MSYGSDLLTAAFKDDIIVLPLKGIESIDLTTNVVNSWKIKNVPEAIEAIRGLLDGNSEPEFNIPEIVAGGNPTIVGVTRSAFGMKVMFSDSPNDGDQRPIEFLLGGTGVEPITFAVTPSKPSFSFIVFFISVTGGKAEFQAPNDGTITIGQDEARPGATLGSLALTGRHL